MIYDLGKKVVATAIINRPEVNSSTTTNGDPCRYVFTGGRMPCLLLPLTASFPSGLLLKWRSQNKFYFYWEGRHTHVHKTKLFPVWKRFISSNHIQTSQHWKHCQGTGKMCMFHLLHTLSCTLSVTSCPCKLHMPFREQGKIVWLATRAQILASMSPVKIKY